MHFQFLYKLFKTKLAIKIWLYLTLIILSFLLLIGALMELFLRNYVMTDQLNAAINNTDHCATAFYSEYNKIIENFVTYTASDDFYDLLNDIKYSNSDKYIEYSTDIQKYLTQYSNISTLITGSMITTPKDRVFYSYKFRLEDQNVPYTLNYDFDNISRIALFPISTSPFKQQGAVIPLVFLLHISPQDKLTLLADDVDSADAILYIFLSANKVNDYMNLYYNNSESSPLYLADDEGNPISIASSSTYYNAVTDQSLKSTIQDLIQKDQTYEQLNTDYVILKHIQNSNLYLVNILSHSDSIAPLRQLDLFLLFVFTLILLVIPFLGFLISIFVTKPLKELITTVKEIEGNTYSTPSIVSKNDEIGELGRAFDSMQNTIHKQFGLIKQEEHENFQMEIRLLSEQINPHFLYNTLEGINMEIYNHHNETASNMLVSLSNYLRISLSYGNNQIKLQTELDQVNAYVNIMNYRFQHSIKLNINIDPELASMLILKSILQPFVENTIKHGFSIDNTNTFSLPPVIDISVKKNDHYLFLIIADNGSGIDIKRAQDIMKREGEQPENKNHVGLHNVYSRLCSFYPNADITFSSIPYYENQVILSIPWDIFLKSQIIIDA